MQVKIIDAPPFDGDYHLDLEGQPFNGWDLHLVKQFAGVRAAELKDAITAGDYDLMIAIAVIALKRAGKISRDEAVQTANALLEVEAGKIQFEEEEADASPPPPRQSGHAPTESSEPSGHPSNGTGDDLPEITPTPIGSPG